MDFGSFEEPYEQIFEGSTMLLAAVGVTWVLFWMRPLALYLRPLSPRVPSTRTATHVTGS